MQAFHNDIAVKQKYVDRIDAHIKADELVRGVGFEDGRGCAVGCTLNNYDHKQYEIELGIPEWLARVEDVLFEGMNQKKSRTWPKLFLEAIKPGIDLEQVKAPFVIFILESNLANFDHEQFPDCKKAIGACIELYKAEEWNESAAESAAWSAARSAESAARSAESAAESAARSAAWSAARSAAWSAARSAAWSAESAARSAESAAWSAARSAAYDKFADKLIELLQACE